MSAFLEHHLLRFSHVKLTICFFLLVSLKGKCARSTFKLCFCSCNLDRLDPILSFCEFKTDFRLGNQLRLMHKDLMSTQILTSSDQSWTYLNKYGGHTSHMIAGFISILSLQCFLWHPHILQTNLDILPPIFQ